MVLGTYRVNAQPDGEGGVVAPFQTRFQVTGVGEIGHGGEGYLLIGFIGIDGAKIGIILFYAVDSELS